jgi:hypothetical protein
MASDLRLFRVRREVAEMGQDCNNQLDITKLGRKRGKSTKKCKKANVVYIFDRPWYTNCSYKVNAVNHPLLT